MANPLWKSTVSHVLERLRDELEQIERHTKEGDPYLAWQTARMAERSILDIISTLKEAA